MSSSRIVHSMKTSLFFFWMTWSLVGLGQDFTLHDSTFVVGACHTIDPPVRFNFNQAAILQESFGTLDSVSAFLLKHPELIVDVRVHTDSRGSQLYSKRLDYSRAKAVAAYFVAAGVPENRLTPRGMGESEPRVSDEVIARLESAEEKEAAHAMNRRVEVVIIGKTPE